jgi:hypothetical protein
MTHFLFLEKPAPGRDRQRGGGQSEGGSTVARSPQSVGTPVPPEYLYIVVPAGAGYRVLRATFQEVSEVPGLGTANGDPAAIVQRLLGSVAAVVPAETAATLPETTREVERFGDVEIDVPARVVRRRGEVVSLAPLEFDLLLALARRRGAAVSRRDLLREVWGSARSVSVRTVDTHISNVRRKIERNPASPRHILTVKKVGYRLQR